jgi:Reverse transcriptase (RNA-dependent DNA polymerase)
VITERLVPPLASFEPAIDGEILTLMRIAPSKSPQQSAYRSFHATETAVLSFHNELVRATDSYHVSLLLMLDLNHVSLLLMLDLNHVSLLLMLDLSAAFDTVDNNILLSVIYVDSTSLTELWLDGRSRCSIRHGQQTCSYEVDCGVPQGSVLGPVVFVAYTEDIADVVDTHHVRSPFYADDTQLYDSSEHYAELPSAPS